MPRPLLTTLLLIGAMTAALAPSSRAQAPLPDSLADSAVFSVLTIAPGENYFNMWGHSALRVQDATQGINMAVNYATFDRTDMWFQAQFVYGQITASLSMPATEAFLFSAALQKRSVHEQLLDLTTEEKRALWQRLLEDAEHIGEPYVYDFYADNCSTRLLDLLQGVTSANLPELPDTHTFRNVLDEHLVGHPGFRLFKDWSYGAVTDRTMTDRERGFLPLTLMALVDGATRAGGSPIVRKTRTILSYPPVAPPTGIPGTVFGGWIIALLLAAWTAVRRGRGPSGLDRLLLVVLGLAGWVLLSFWFMTYHWVAAWNMNLLWALPVHLPMALFAWRASWRNTYLRWTAVSMVAVAGVQLLFLQPFPLPLLPVVVAVAGRIWWQAR